ncbi:large conductance mechanosensitive channel protein MscL [Aeromicrobium sp. SMF47]|uniref:Large-conductance mechanosensitive channel n=1 Tax=Aeromicrobium yanjiei TaxID=2662028 RepID=A0A5Q2MPC0_9ACTN|nr:MULTISPECIES: large conductance mechanosensitive channel protein MscL [Aeromicrobium]MRJ76412.1 large conductance mechanosensitive channel protein MscL [Aeromicrobium yanjiei]MRK00763.1 large conductance mechanosensitive channel protein MscL [Aeromicrobium sp. S22]QGG42415.1 large conductance mechanosensitive channel protein MscL [Aeromicrobium yanjiei]
MLKGFKDFLLRGNIVDLAVAVVIGTAFTALVSSFTSSFINPLLAAAGGRDSANGLGFKIFSGNDETLVDVGGFINSVITFVITAAVVYFFIVVPMKKINERRDAGKEPEPEGVSEDIALLREIRDSLKSRPGGTTQL